MNQAVINDQTINISTTTAVSLETNTKTPNTPTLFYRNILNGVDANYQITKIPFKIKEEIILKQKISNDEFLISNQIQNLNNQNRHPMSVLGAKLKTRELNFLILRRDDGQAG